jgi:hypothetical protein
MRRETLKTNKTVVAELELEAPFSAKQKGVLHNSDRSFFPTLYNDYHYCLLNVLFFDNLFTNISITTIIFINIKSSSIKQQVRVQ